MKGEGIFFRGVGTAHFSDELTVWEITDGYFVSNSHGELRAMVFICFLELFSVYLSHELLQ